MPEGCREGVKKAFDRQLRAAREGARWEMRRKGFMTGACRWVVGGLGNFEPHPKITDAREWKERACLGAMRERGKLNFERAWNRDFLHISFEIVLNAKVC